MTRIVLLCVLASVGVAVSGCNTMEGLGQDTQAAGSALERKSDQVKPY